MDRLTPPKPLTVEENLVEKWKRWKQNFSLYLTATEYTKKLLERGKVDKYTITLSLIMKKAL